MILEKIIAKKDAGDFLNYTIIKKLGAVSNNNLPILIDAIRADIFQDILEYENSAKTYLMGSSDTWNVHYNDQDKSYYLQLYDYFEQEIATKHVTDHSEINLYEINSLKIKTRENLLELINSWQLIVKKKPEYIIVTKNDRDLIKVELQEELSDNDLIELKNS